MSLVAWPFAQLGTSHTARKGIQDIDTLIPNTLLSPLLHFGRCKSPLFPPFEALWPARSCHLVLAESTGHVHTHSSRRRHMTTGVDSVQKLDLAQEAATAPESLAED